MKKLLFIMTMAVLAASCSKDKNINPVNGNAQLKKIAAYTYQFENDPVENGVYTYDGEGRLSKVVEGDNIYQFTHTGPASFRVDETRTGNPAFVQTIYATLDAQGRITDMLFKDGNGTLTYTYKYEYDAGGFMIRKTGTGYNMVTEQNYEYNNGNLVSGSLWRNGEKKSIRTYKTDPSLPNKSGIPYDYYWVHNTWFGKAGKNYITDFIDTDINGQVTWHAKNSYQLDSNNYPVTITTEFITDNSHAVYKPVYK